MDVQKLTNHCKQQKYAFHVSGDQPQTLLVAASLRSYNYSDYLELIGIAQPESILYASDKSDKALEKVLARQFGATVVDCNLPLDLINQASSMGSQLEEFCGDLAGAFFQSMEEGYIANQLSNVLKSTESPILVCAPGRYFSPSSKVIQATQTNRKGPRHVVPYAVVDTSFTCARNVATWKDFYTE